MGWENPRPRKIEAAADYDAFIVAVDLPAQDQESRPSAHAWEIRKRATGEIVDSDETPSDQVLSSQNKAYVTGLYRTIEALPDGSAVHIISLGEFIVKGITEWLPEWRRNGWRRSNGEKVAYADVWQKIDDLLKLCKISATAIRPCSTDRNSLENIERLKDRARAVCKKRSRDLGLPTGSFDVVPGGYVGKGRKPRYKAHRKIGGS